MAKVVQPPTVHLESLDGLMTRKEPLTHLIRPLGLPRELLVCGPGLTAALKQELFHFEDVGMAVCTGRRGTLQRERPQPHRDKQEAWATPIG